MARNDVGLALAGITGEGEFQRNIENNVKFVAFFRKRLSNSWYFYILRLSNLWLNEVETC